MNCDSEAYYNKESNKYDLEGAKGPEQIADYYLKLCQDHPLCAYLEDAMCESEGY